MSDLTCDWCFDQRHHRCRGCACNICAKRTKPPVVRVPRDRRKEGPHGLKGRSTLPLATQHAVARALAERQSMSAIARDLGISKDQVRTIRDRPVTAP